MLKYISTIFIIFCFVGCSDTVTIVEENPIPTDPDEIFEINLVGYTTDRNRVYISDVSLQMEGVSISSDASGFTHIENQLIGKQGKAIKVVKDGYLPTFKRIYHHRSLQTITANIQLTSAPNSVVVPASGGEILSGNIRLEIEGQDLENSTDLVFYSSTGEESIEFDNLITKDKVQYLQRDALFYMDLEGELTEGKSLEIFIPQAEVNIDGLFVFKYDEASYTWIKTDHEITNSGTDVKFEIDRKGWWSIGHAIDVVYASLELEQLGNIKIAKSEVFLRSANNKMKEVLYTDTNGRITKYFPIHTELKASLDEGNLILPIDDQFTSKDQKISSYINQDIIYTIGGEVYSCELSKQQGYVSLKSESQHEIIKLTEGLFNGISLKENGQVELSYYNDEFLLLNTQLLNVDQIQNTNLGYVACNNQMVVQDNSTVLEDFDICRVRVNPNESVVIGESDDTGSDVFLISFKGETTGTYSGLFFSTRDGFGSNVNSEVDIEILVYNTATNLIAGKVIAEYKDSGEQFDVSFIGEIE